MDAAQVIMVLELLGVEDIIKDEAQRAVKSSCPLAEWKHQGSNKTPSLTVTISRGSELPTYTCSACGARGVLPNLVEELQSLSAKCYPEASTLVAEAMKLKGKNGSSTRRRIRVDGSAPKFVRSEGAAPAYLDEAALEPYPLLADSEFADAESLMDWLHDVHGISSEVARRHGLRLHVDPHLREARVALPVIDPVTGGILELWTWLPDLGKAHRILTTRHKPQGRSQVPTALFGLECLSADEPVLLVQSALGAMRLESMRLKNVVAVLGGTVPDLSALNRAAHVFLAFDQTPEGLILTKQAAKAFDKPQLHLLKWSDECTSSGQPVQHTADVEALASFKVVFEKRIRLAKAKSDRAGLTINDTRREAR